MKNTKRSAFTIVELVIVIAVIAILSAVLIPTFGAIIKDANIAADQTAAATLTTELHVYLKGDTIDNEAELMAALNDEKLGFTEQKLTPKAAAYGVHFWFDMDNQMIVAKTADEIIEMVSDRETAAIQSGVVLMADGAHPTGADINFRAILGGGFFLIDKGGSSIVDLLAKIDAVKDAETYNDIALYTLEESDKDYELANKILDAVKSTVILSDYGAFYCTGAESYNVYVAMGTQCINTDRYVFNGSTTKTTGDLPTLKGAFTLPKTVLDVAAGALNFTGSATIKVPYDANGIKKVFGPQSTNATIKGTDNDYKVLSGVDTSDGHAADRLVLASDDSWVADLFAKLPFADFEIFFDVDATTGVDQWNSGNLYMFYGDFKETENQFNITYGEDKTVFPGTSNLIRWNSSNSSVARFSGTNGLLTIAANTDPADRNTTITATAVNINGETITKTITLTMVKPTAATVGEAFDIPGAETYTWKYSGRNGNINFEYNVIYNDNSNWDIAVGTSSLVVDEDTAFEYADDKLTLKTDANGKIYAGTHSFDLIVDGCLTETVTIDLKDQSDSPITHKFHYTNERVNSGVSGQYHYYNYYVGNLDAIKLSDLLKLKDGKTFETATLKIYAENASGDRQELVGDTLGVSVALDGTAYAKNGITITPDDLDKTIKFSGTNDPIDGWKVVIEIVPENYGTFAMEVVVVDGNNVTASNVSTYLGTALSNNIVLLSDLTIASGQRFEVGAKTFYGNGFVIDATSFDSKQGRDYVIKLNGGTVDNIYLDGPVFPTLNFDGDYTSDPCHASGIQSAGASIIKNSYISNFRQPVRVDGTSIKIENTTLDGGRLANLVVVNGKVELIDVNTIQKLVQHIDSATNTTTDVIGAGIYVGNDWMSGLLQTSAPSVLNTEFSIKGSFKQYNWLSTDDTSAMPIIGIDGYVEYNVGSFFKNVINNTNGGYAKFQDLVNSDGNKKYMNGGILFVASLLRTKYQSQDFSKLTRTTSIVDNRTNTDKKLLLPVSETKSKTVSFMALDVKAEVYSYSKYSDEAGTQEVLLTSTDLNYSGRYLNYGSN